MLIVTAATADYWPGAIALYNSLAVYSPGVQFTCLCYGMDADDVTDLTYGARAMEGPHIATNKPAGEHENNDAMYCRLLLPSLFPDEERIVWADCDQVAVGDISELADIDLGQYACAMVPTGYPITFQMRDTPGYRNDHRSGFAGLIVIDCARWRELNVTQRCLEVMANPGELRFRYVVQSVLNHVLDGEFMPLPEHWQGFGNRTDFKLTPAHRFVHWHGRGTNPWQTHNERTGLPIPNREIWERYA